MVSRIPRRVESGHPAVNICTLCSTIPTDDEATLVEVLITLAMQSQSPPSIPKNPRSFSSSDSYSTFTNNLLLRPSTTTSSASSAISVTAPTTSNTVSTTTNKSAAKGPPSSTSSLQNSVIPFPQSVPFTHPTLNENLIKTFQFHHYERVFQHFSSEKQIRAWTEPGQTWHLLLYGTAGTSAESDTMIRQVEEVQCSENFDSMLKFLGFSFDFDFIQKGWRFQVGQIEMLIYKLYRIQEKKSPWYESLTRPMTGKMKYWMVEANLLCKSDERLDVAQKALVQFTSALCSRLNFYKESVK